MSIIKRMELENNMYNIQTIRGSVYEVKNINDSRKYRVFSGYIDMGEVETLKDVIDLITLHESKGGGLCNGAKITK